MIDYLLLLHIYGNVH